VDRLLQRRPYAADRSTRPSPWAGASGHRSFDIGGIDIAIAAAQNYRALRKRGITVRKTIDAVIATRCIENGYDLLYSDRDFEPFAKYLGLRVAGGDEDMLG
jgi:hypothetical protein